MNDQFSRILGYVEQIDKRLEKVEKLTSQIPIVLAQVEANDLRLCHANATLRGHEQHVVKAETRQ